MEEKLREWKSGVEETKRRSDGDTKINRHRSDNRRKYCRNWNKGECWDKDCGYLHEEIPTCRYGTGCKWMDRCMFKHIVLDKHGDEQAYYRGTKLSRNIRNR